MEFIGNCGEAMNLLTYSEIYYTGKFYQSDYLGEQRGI
jgi:hypothetical protein